MRRLILLPAHNEAEALPALLDEIAEAKLEADVWVVDDASTDTTAEVAAAGGAKVLRIDPHAGLGGALRRAFAQAVEAGYEQVIRLDADGQHPPQSVAVLLEVARDSGADLVVGSRFGGTATDYRGHPVRRLGVGLLSATLSWIVRQPLRDPASGFQVLSPSFLAWAAQQYPDHYPEPKALVAARRAGLTIREEPVRFRHRQAGRSSMTPVRSIRHVLGTTAMLLREALGGRVSTDT